MFGSGRIGGFGGELAEAGDLDVHRGKLFGARPTVFIRLPSGDGVGRFETGGRDEGAFELNGLPVRGFGLRAFPGWAGRGAAGSHDEDIVGSCSFWVRSWRGAGVHHIALDQIAGQ